MTITLTTKNTTQLSTRWLGLGKKIEGKTIDEILDESGLNWGVSKRPLLTCSETTPLHKNNPLPMNNQGTERNNNLIKNAWKLVDCLGEEEARASLKDIEDNPPFIPLLNQFAIVRNDTNQPLGVMGRAYTFLNNRDCLDIIKPLLDEGRLEVERAGSFNYGANVWVICRMPKSLTVGPSDVMDQFLRLSWSHDGTQKLSASFIAYLRRSNVQVNPKVPGSRVSIEIRHTLNAKQRIKIAKDLLAKGEQYFNCLENVLGELVNTPINGEEMDKYLDVIFPKKNASDVKPNKHGEIKLTSAISDHNKNRIKQIFVNQSNDISHTKYAAFISIADWCDNNKLVRVRGETVTRENKDEARLRGIWDKNGSAHKMKERAFAEICR